MGAHRELGSLFGNCRSRSLFGGLWRMLGNCMLQRSARFPVPGELIPGPQVAALETRDTTIGEKLLELYLAVFLLCYFN